MGRWMWDQATGYGEVPLLLYRSGEAGDVLHGAAEAFDFDPEAAECVHGEHAAVMVDGNDVGEHASESEGLGGFAERIHEGVVPGASVAHVFEDSVERRVGLVEPGQHR